MDETAHSCGGVNMNLLQQSNNDSFTLHPLQQQHQQHQHQQHQQQQHHHQDHPGITNVLDSVRTIDFQAQELGEISNNLTSENQVTSMNQYVEQQEDVNSYNIHPQTMDGSDTENHTHPYELKPYESTSRILSSFLEQLYSMQASNQYTDTAIVFSYHERPVTAHAAVLAASIPTFKQHVKVSNNSNTDYRYCLSFDKIGLELSRADMDCFVRFCYTREFKTYPGMSCNNLIVLAKEMGLDALVIWAQTFNVEQELDEQVAQVEQTNERSDEHIESKVESKVDGDKIDRDKIDMDKVARSLNLNPIESDDDLPPDDFPVRFNDEDELVIEKQAHNGNKSLQRACKRKRLRRSIKTERKSCNNVRRENESNIDIDIPENPAKNTEIMDENEIKMNTADNESSSEQNGEKLQEKVIKNRKQSNRETPAPASAKKPIDYTACKLCHEPLDTTTRKGYMLHKKTDCAKMKFRNHTGPKCRKCQLTFSADEELDEHIKEVHVKRYQCADCNRIFQREDLLVMHMHSEHNYPIPEEKFDILICKIEDCEYQTIVKEEYRAHSANHMKQQQQQQKNDTLCLLCGKKYKTKASLYSHRRKIHSPSLGPKPQCQQCGKFFKNTTTLQSHIKWAHEKSDPLLCNHCPYSVRTPREFYNHLMVEHQVEPPSNFKKHVCKDCGYRTLNKNYYEIHCRKHTGEKPYQCSECGHAFTSQSELSSHVKWHVTERPFPCPHCEHKAIDKSKLQKHIEYMHTAKDDKKWECHKCAYKSNIKGNLRMHLKKIHKIEVPTQRHLVQDPSNIIVGRTNVRLLSPSGKTRKRPKTVVTDVQGEDPTITGPEHQVIQPPPLPQPPLPQNVLVVSNPPFHTAEPYFDALPAGATTNTDPPTLLASAEVPIIGQTQQLVVEHGIPVQDSTGATQILMRRPVNMMLGEVDAGQHEVVISSTTDHHQQQQQQQAGDIIIPVISSSTVGTMVANGEQQQQQQQYQTMYTTFSDQQLYSGQIYMNQ